RESCVSYGMFHQLRVDHGKEFYLMLGMQEIFENLRSRGDIQCYRQTESKKNLPVERFWVEMNGRVNYPLKTALVWLDNNNIFDINDEIQKYSVSRVSMAVAKYGAGICIRSWNEHHIRGRGKPRTIKDETNLLQPLRPTDLPNVLEAVDLYQQVYRGNLTMERDFGSDPLFDFPDLRQVRRAEFEQHFSMKDIFEDCLNFRSQLLGEAIVWYYQRTLELAR
uniref:Integrase core domain-containing protein n=1 Tax=Clytia hemisphaerica TaxID=252671 RepID=A0A7M5V8Y1_9CNID